MNLQEFKDAMARALYGMTKAEAHHQSVCIDCEKPIDTVPHDEKEYHISGLCCACFNKIMDIEYPKK